MENIEEFIKKSRVLTNEYTNKLYELSDETPELYMSALLAGMILNIKNFYDHTHLDKGTKKMLIIKLFEKIKSDILDHIEDGTDEYE